MMGMRKIGVLYSLFESDIELYSVSTQKWLTKAGPFSILVTYGRNTYYNDI